MCDPITATMAVVGGTTSVYSANKQSKAASKAASASQYAADQSAAVQKEMFDKVWNAGTTQRGIADQALRMLAGSYNIRVPAAAAPAPAAQAPANPAMSRPLVRTPNGYQPSAPAQYPNDYRATAYLPGSTVGQSPASTSPATTGGTTGGTTGATPNPLADFMASPDYTFRLQQGLRGGRNALANMGMLQSGAAARELGNYQGNMALGELNNWRSGLGAITGMGSQAFQTGANAAGNFGNAMSNIFQNNASNQASAYQNRANAMTNMAGGLGGSVLWGLGQFGGK